MNNIVTEALTNQQALDGVRKWISRPNASRCFDGTYMQCIYRRNDGNRCAIGGLLLGRISEDSEAWYDEGGVDQLINAYPDVWDVLHEVDPSLLADMQNAHDRDYSEHWQEKVLSNLHEIADNYELEWKE